MKRRWGLWLIGANLMALGVLVFAYPELMVSPGPVVKEHAEIATDCYACHAPLRGASASRCMACHQPADIGVRTTSGTAVVKARITVPFHQALAEPDCMACHTDHAGPKLTHRVRKPFSHALLKADTRERCEACHTAPKTAVHRDMSAGCSQCHRSDAWKPATFDHDKLFLLDGDHKASCTTCHVAADYSRYTCYGCHEHTPSNIRRKHEEEGIADFGNCVRCHRSADDEPQDTADRGRRGRGGRD